MTYTFLILLAAGIAGVILHNLVKIDDINKDPNKGNFNLGSYWKREWASIFISIIIVVLCAYFQEEVKQLKAAGNWLGLGFVGLGYMAQSLFIKWMGKAQKMIGPDDENLKP